MLFGFVEVIVIMLQLASCAAPAPSGESSCSQRLADEGVGCCKSHAVLVNMIALRHGLG